MKSTHEEKNGSIFTRIFAKIFPKEFKAISGNYVSLIILQGANYIIPFFIFPYLTRVFSPENYGLMSWAISFIAFFQIVTDYSFNISGTMDVSIQRDDKQKLSEIFSSIFSIKVFFSIITFLFLVIIIFSFDIFRRDYFIYIFCFGVVFGSVLLPTWFFQGIEQMKYITVFNLIGQIVFISLVFICIKNNADFAFFIFLKGIIPVITGFLSIIFVKRRYKMIFFKNSLKLFKSQLSNGWTIFLSNCAINLYTFSSTFILGLLTNRTIVAFFSAAYTVFIATRSLTLFPLSQAIYPRTTKYMNESRAKGLLFIRKIMKILFIFSLILSLLVFLFAKPIIIILVGDQYSESIPVLQILALLLFITTFGNVLGVHIMIPLGEKRAYTAIITMACILNIFLSALLIPLYQHVGISISMLITESLVTVGMLLFLIKKRILIFERRNQG